MNLGIKNFFIFRYIGQSFLPKNSKRAAHAENFVGFFELNWVFFAATDFKKLVRFRHSDSATVDNFSFLIFFKIPAQKFATERAEFLILRFFQNLYCFSHKILIVEHVTARRDEIFATRDANQFVHPAGVKNVFATQNFRSRDEIGKLLHQKFQNFAIRIVTKKEFDVWIILREKRGERDLQKILFK